MTPDHVKSIQDSFAKVRPIANTAAALFYNRLFEIAPEVRPLFRGDMTEQGRKLMKVLTLVVNGLAISTRFYLRPAHWQRVMWRMG